MMKRFLNQKIESLLSAILGILGFAACTRKVELEKTPVTPPVRYEHEAVEVAKPDQKKSDEAEKEKKSKLKKVKVVKKADDSTKGVKNILEQVDSVRSSYRVLYGPPPVAYRIIKDSPDGELLRSESEDLNVKD
ncbi:MAG: hypothetical protein NC206_09355 [Bacteroides sp.]|nr:hypothetical protein [Roseburia sp.]MCM1347277.1 hypothetical protein [Bacteroides sp.]MCM1420061.1 hypothetical protein [Bacteroides sp.]